MEKPEELEEVMIKGINRSISINKFTTELYKTYPSIPSDKLLSLTRSFLENLQLLEKIYKAPEKSEIPEYNLEDYKLEENGVVLIPKGWTMDIPKGAIIGPLKLTYFSTLEEYIKIPLTNVIINGKRFYKSDMWDYGRFFMIEY